ncbi:hypothetical protein SLA2020_467900 [Shorea laevis]
MSGNPTGLVRKRSSSLGSQGQHSCEQPWVFTGRGIALDIKQTIHDPLLEDVDHFTFDHDGEGLSSSKGKMDGAGI